MVTEDLRTAKKMRKTNTVASQQNPVQIEYRETPGWPDYKVSNTGLVVSCRKKGVQRQIKPRLMSGYLSLRLFKDNRATTISIHRLVAMAFIGPPPSNKHTVNHKSGNKQDNNVSNLEWATMSEQALHAHRTKLTKGSRRPVIQYSRKGKEIARFISVEAAAEAMGTPQYNISRCANGRRPSASGYIFKFEEPRKEIIELAGEEWKVCKRNSNYLVSNLGRIANNTIHDKDCRLLAQRNSGSYHVVSLIIGHKRQTVRVHRLVAECFVDNPHGYDVVNHKDHNRDNNDWRNLEWTTFTGNNRHGSGKPILQLNSKGDLIRRFISISEAMEHLHASRDSIKKCLSSKLGTSYHGYYFNYDMSNKIEDAKISSANPKRKSSNAKYNSKKLYDKPAVVSSSSSESFDDDDDEIKVAKTSELAIKYKTGVGKIAKKSQRVDTPDEEPSSDEKEQVQKSSKRRGNYIPCAQRCTTTKKLREDTSVDDSETSDDSSDEIQNFWALQANTT